MKETEQEQEACFIALDKFNTMLNKVLNSQNNYTEDDFSQLEVILKYALNIVRQYNDLLTEDICNTFNPKYERLKDILNKNNNLKILSYKDMENTLSEN